MTLPFGSLDFEPGLEAPAASSPSSKVVALVEQDPWAEELLLCGGDASGSRPSALKIDFPSPLPFKSEGVLELR